MAAGSVIANMNTGRPAKNSRIQKIPPLALCLIILILFHIFLYIKICLSLNGFPKCLSSLAIIFFI